MLIVHKCVLILLTVTVFYFHLFPNCPISVQCLLLHGQLCVVICVVLHAMVSRLLMKNHVALMHILVTIFLYTFCLFSTTLECQGNQKFVMVPLPLLLVYVSKLVKSKL